MKIGYDQQLAELDRELAMRRNVYPKWVRDGRMKEATADRQIAALEAARETVRQARQAEVMRGMDGGPMK